MVKRAQFGLAELVFTSDQAEPFKVIDKTYVETLISSKISKTASLEIVNDIDARNSLELSSDAIVYVLNASADAAVGEGSALYGYKHTERAFTLLLSAGNRGSVQWDEIEGRPNSSAEDIDAAVSIAHSHENKEVLDGLTGVEGNLYYKGKAIPVFHFIGDGW
ncbi:hypothetical protein ACPF8X_40150 [Streptomyces sp. G35A]